MKVYLVDFGEYSKSYGYYGPPEQVRVVELVTARSRGQARYLAWKHNSDILGDLTEQPCKTKVLLISHHSSPAMVASKVDPLWGLTCVEHWGRPCPDW